MRTELANEFRRLMDNEIESRPSAMCFEFAYQGKVAMDRIRFAIRSVERFANHSGPALEANLRSLKHWSVCNLLSDDSKMHGADIGTAARASHIHPVSPPTRTRLCRSR
jgi:hypothetical protein